MCERWYTVNEKKKKGENMKIVVLDGYTENPGDLSWDGFRQFGEVIVYDRTPKELILSRMDGAEVVFTNKVVITRKIIEASPALRFIGTLSTGYNTVDLEAADERQIPVSNIPSYSTQAVAQLTMALLLEICHHVGAHSAQVMAGKWSNCPDFCFWSYPSMELAGKTMGIIGYGNIGQAVARLTVAFGMNVIAYGHHGIKEELLTEHVRSVSLEELYKESDVISLHCPLTKENMAMIRKDSIAKMKDGVILLNTARGPLICEQDLKEALVSGKVSCAAMDVVETEPIPEDSPLLSAPNVLITPHIAWAAKETRQRLMDIAVENLSAYVHGKPIHVVNLKSKG